MKDWIKLCRSVEVDCNNVGSVMHYFDNCLDRMTKGMPRRRQQVLPGRVSWRVLDIFYLGGKSPASAGNSAALAGNSALGGKFCYQQEICTILLKSAIAGNLLPRSVGGKSPAHGVGGKICCPDRKSPARGVSGKLSARNVGGIACLGGFTNSVPADVIVAALAGYECYQPGTASVQLPI
ncbi:hypothetical protein V6N13_023158 [Hibiscus sabdariffa]